MLLLFHDILDLHIFEIHIAILQGQAQHPFWFSSFVGLRMHWTSCIWASILVVTPLHFSVVVDCLELPACCQSSTFHAILLLLMLDQGLLQISLQWVFLCHLITVVFGPWLVSSAHEVHAVAGRSHRNSQGVILTPRSIFWPRHFLSWPLFSLIVIGFQVIYVLAEMVKLILQEGNINCCVTISLRVRFLYNLLVLQTVWLTLWLYPWVEFHIWLVTLGHQIGQKYSILLCSIAAAQSLLGIIRLQTDSFENATSLIKVLNRKLLFILQYIPSYIIFMHFVIIIIWREISHIWNSSLLDWNC